MGPELLECNITTDHDSFEGVHYSGNVIFLYQGKVRPNSLLGKHGIVEIRGQGIYEICITSFTDPPEWIVRNIREAARGKEAVDLLYKATMEGQIYGKRHLPRNQYVGGRG